MADDPPAPQANELRITSTADITSRPRYTDDVIPERNPFKRIIKPYYLHVPMQCGIGSCKTWHNDGFLVELENGDETNIGHVCGGKYFGTRFLDGVESYTREKLLPELRLRLGLEKPKINAALPQLRTWCELESQVLGKQRRNFRRIFQTLSKELSRRASRGDVAVTTHRERSNEEIERLGALNPNVPRERFRYEEVRVAELQGIRTFDHNLHELLHTTLLGKAQEFLDAPLATLKLQKLIEWDSWSRIFDDEMSRARTVLTDAQNFFSSNNFEALRQLGGSPDEQRILRVTSPEKLSQGNPRDLLTKDVEKTLNRRQRRQLMHGSRNRKQ